jgi:hypothetical protein
MDGNKNRTRIPFIVGYVFRDVIPNTMPPDYGYGEIKFAGGS